MFVSWLFGFMVKNDLMLVLVYYLVLDILFFKEFYK